MTAMNKPAQDLEVVLKEEIRLYEKYGEFLKGDSDRMTQLNVEELEASNKAKETIVLKVQALEQVRQQLVFKLAKEKGISSEKVRLKDLCDHIETDQSQKLMNLRSELVAFVENLKVNQRQTATLAKSSMHWIEGAMGTLKNLLSPSGTYDARGNVGKSKLFAGHVVENKA